MLSVITPTLWKYPPYLEFLPTILAQESVGEVIIINNAPYKTPDDPILSHPKIRMCNQEKNLYIAPSWNLGATLATYDKLCFIADDVKVGEILFDRVDPYVTEDIGMIHVQADYESHTHVYHRTLTDGSVTMIDAEGLEVIGIGGCFFIHKKNYYHIPKIKVIYGECLIWDYQIKAGRKNLAAVNVHFYSPWHVSAHHMDEIENHENVKYEEDRKAYYEVLAEIEEEAKKRDEAKAQTLE